jgi:hypothetical protein
VITAECRLIASTLASAAMGTGLGIIRDHPTVIDGMRPESQVRNGLAAGGRRIRTIGPARETDGRGEGDPWPTIVVSRDPCLNDPIQLIGPASLFGNGRDPVVRAGLMVRIQFPPAVSLRPFGP